MNFCELATGSRWWSAERRGIAHTEYRSGRPGKRSKKSLAGNAQGTLPLAVMPVEQEALAAEAETVDLDPTAAANVVPN